jgi:hypothetical protein
VTKLIGMTKLVGKMDQITLNYLKTDYRTILEHPAMTTDMKVGYLMAVLNMAPHCSNLPLRDLAAAIKTFVIAYEKQIY